MEYIHIQGLDLQTDPTVIEICKTSNSTSSSTRSVLYVLVIVNILALITAINTWPLNWTDARISKLENDFATLPAMIKQAGNSSTAKSITDKLKMDSILWQFYKRFDIENYHNIKIPILGNAFDVNNLSLIAGMTFVVLLIVLRFTLGRELVNLRLALNSITNRYPDYANKDQFKNSVADYDWPDVMPSINRVRRLHHYNSLSMNEIFNLPPLEISSNRVQNRFSGRALMYMFYFPSVIYASIFANDIATIGKALEENSGETVAFMLLSVLFLSIIILLSIKCTTLKRKIYQSYVEFKNNHYRYVQQ